MKFTDPDRAGEHIFSVLGLGVKIIGLWVVGEKYDDPFRKKRENKGKKRKTGPYDLSGTMHMTMWQFVVSPQRYGRRIYRKSF